MSSEVQTVSDRKVQQVEINCFFCRHFYITYDRRFPYGCRAVGFKSRLMPYREMYANSGIECQLFQHREER